MKPTIQNKTILKVYSELNEQIDNTQKEATKILRLHRDKYRLHMNAETLNSEDYSQSEDKWNTIDQKLKTLNQIKLILENHKKSAAENIDLKALDDELVNYINKAIEKELHNIASIFIDYRNRLGLEDSELEELIKLKIKPKSNSQYIKEMFLKACQNLDASIFEPLIDEDQYFEELDKYRFLHSMKEQFDFLKENGVEKVEMVMGTCKMCFVGERVYEFYKESNKGKPAFAYNIQEDNGNIKDIFRCNYSDGYQRDARGNMGSGITFIND